jgi:hypothetical protein
MGIDGEHENSGGLRLALATLLERYSPDKCPLHGFNFF